MPVQRCGPVGPVTPVAPVLVYPDPLGPIDPLKFNATLAVFIVDFKKDLYGFQQRTFDIELPKKVRCRNRNKRF